MLQLVLVENETDFFLFNCYQHALYGLSRLHFSDKCKAMQYYSHSWSEPPARGSKHQTGYQLDHVGLPSRGEHLANHHIHSLGTYREFDRHMVISDG